MAGAKEIRSKIASIKSTQKITSAMEKVAVSKMRKAQMRMAASRPYAERIRQVIGHLAFANPEYRHPFMVERPVKRVGYIVVSTDRGLCGGLNINLFKVLIKNMKEWHDQKVEVDLCVIGNKGAIAIGEAIRINATLKLKTLVVPAGLEKNPQLIAACREKGVELVVVTGV